jgi:hypothetical protein
MPSNNASNNSAIVTRNTGNTNISAPVLIKIGGKMIFLAFVGLEEALILIKSTNNAIKTAIKDDTTITVILPLRKDTLAPIIVENGLKRNETNQKFTMHWNFSLDATFFMLNFYFDPKQKMRDAPHFILLP